MTHSNLVTVFNGTIQNTQVQLCNARELHQFLEVGKVYAAWIQERIADYGFTQDEDYIIITERTNGRPRKEYHITLDMGKELGMVERNEKGRQIRKYFIACEKGKPQQLALPEPITYHMTIDEVISLAWLWRVAENCRELLEILYPALEKIGSSYAGTARGHATEHVRTIEFGRQVIAKITADLTDRDHYAAYVLNGLRRHKI